VWACRSSWPLEDSVLNAKAAPHLEFAPPPQPGAGRAWLTAGLVHALLFLALGLATAWKTQTQTVQAEAELWSATPQAAAPRLQEPPVAEPEPEPEPQPEPPPRAKPTPPPPPAPDPAIERRDAQIALEKKKQIEKKKEAEKAEQEKAKADQQRKAREKEEKAAKEKAEKDKAQKEKVEKEKAAKEKAAKEKKAQEDKEREKKKAAEKAAEKADAARADALRQENLKRMQGMAGASGGENATGSALKSAGPSASYAGRLVGRIKPNITYPGDVVGNPRAEVEVRVSSDGTITSRRIAQSSGNKAWDEAVLRAIDKTEILPKDTDGRVPPVIILGFRPQD
jgi:colicin import membrane protein